MINLPEDKILYSEIQKKLFYLIPEKWDSIFLYASIIDIPNQKPVGEMFFYYLPKGIIKKKFVNGYEIPNLFNIDEEQYSKLIADIYKSIKSLRECLIRKNGKRWSSVTISIENYQFKAEFDYQDLLNSNYESYERHVIWRYKNLKEDIDLLSKKDKKIIDRYIEDMKTRKIPKRDIYIEGVYKLPVKNIIDYERTLTVDEAIAQSITDSTKEKKKINIIKRKKEHVDEEDNNDTLNNQILNWKK